MPLRPVTRGLAPHVVHAPVTGGAVRARVVAVGAALAALAPLALGGCGAERAVHLDGGLVRLSLEEYRILPRTVSVPAGRVRIVVSNRGVLAHSMALEQGSLEAGSTPIILATTHTLLPGATRALLTKPLEPGRYLLVSTTGNQAVLGMVGTLVVR